MVSLAFEQRARPFALLLNHSTGTVRDLTVKVKLVLKQSVHGRVWYGEREKGGEDRDVRWGENWHGSQPWPKPGRLTLSGCAILEAGPAHHALQGPGSPHPNITVEFKPTLRI
jgi:hypothetical protein